jgi:hypothetical protein
MAPETRSSRETTADSGRLVGAPSSYEPPTLRYLGTLRELTLGGTPGLSDGVGSSGDTAST